MAEPDPREPVIEHVQDEKGGMFSIEEDGRRLAELTWVRSSDTLAIADHTFVDPAGRGRGLGKALVIALTEWAREQGVKIVPLCPYAKGVYARHPELRDVVI